MHNSEENYQKDFKSKFKDKALNAVAYVIESGGVCASIKRWADEKSKEYEQRMIIKYGSKEKWEKAKKIMEKELNERMRKSTNGYKIRYKIFAIFFGMFGVHKFYAKKYIMGFVYLFTLGLFLIGWLVDAVRAIAGNVE